MGRGKKKARLKTSAASDVLVVDGSQGEGGGQILRSSLSLAALTGRPLRLERIRAGRAKPGLAAQHLASTRAVCELVNGDLVGDALGSTRLDFQPRRRPRAGRYHFNVAEHRKGGSAGAVALVLQSVLLPLALADGDSELTLLGGTHVPHSPPFDFLAHTFLPTLRSLGLAVDLDLRRPGFYPVGGGRFTASVKGAGQLAPLALERPGQLRSVQGRLLTAGLPAHVAARMEETTRAELASLAVPLELEIVSAEAKSPGAAVFLAPEYASGRAGFSAIGERGRPAEKVAKEACQALLEHHRSQAAVDVRLADQLLLPLAFATGPSSFTTSRASQHLKTNALVIEQFGVAIVEIDESVAPVRVVVRPRASH